MPPNTEHPRISTKQAVDICEEVILSWGKLISLGKKV